MADLLISAHQLGPLSIEIRDSGGGRVGRPASLSSSRQEATIGGIPPGDYTIIATRPSGDQIVEPVKVGGNRTRAILHADGPSPHEFMTEATSLGLLQTGFALSGRTSFDLAGPFEAFRPNGEQIGLPTRIGGPAGQNLLALQSFAGLGTGDLGVSRRGPARDGTPRKSGSLVVAFWEHGENGWERVGIPTARVDHGPQFLRIRMPIEPGVYLEIQDAKVRAVGLLNDDSYGPIVIVPPFREGIDITFVAEGVGTPTDGARVDNPSAIRSPVALAVPRDPKLADLLIGLNAAAMRQADALWDDTAQATHAGPDEALDYLLYKYRDPAAATLGALFLARFSPKRIPMAWLENLCRIAPHLADGALLLAWMKMTRGDDPALSPDAVRGMIRTAAKRPCLMFARTRSMLVQAARLHGPYTRARKLQTSSPRHPRPGDFLDFAADAGGLECFWGSSPVRPGKTAVESRARNWERRIMLIDGQFR